MDVVGNDKLIGGVYGQVRTDSLCNCFLRDYAFGDGIDVGGGDALVCWVRAEVVEGSDAEDDIGERGGDLGILHIRDVSLAAYVEVMDLSPEGSIDLAGGTGKINHEAALGDAVDLEAMIRKPLCDFVDVCRIGTEFLAEFVGGEPLVEVRVAGLMHIVDQFFERGFTIGGALELKEHMLHFETFAALAAIVEGIRLVAHVAGQGDHLGVVDWSCDLGACVEGGLGMGARRREKIWRCKTGAASHCAEQAGMFHRVPPEVRFGFLNVPGDGPTA